MKKLGLLKRLRSDKKEVALEEESQTGVHMMLVAMLTVFTHTVIIKTWKHGKWLCYRWICAGLASVANHHYGTCATSVIATLDIILSVHLLNKSTFAMTWKVRWFSIQHLELLNDSSFQRLLAGHCLVCIWHVLIPQRRRCSSAEIAIQSSCWCSSLCWWGTWCSVWLCRSYAAGAKKNKK